MAWMKHDFSLYGLSNGEGSLGLLKYLLSWPHSFFLLV